MVSKQGAYREQVVGPLKQLSLFGVACACYCTYAGLERLILKVGHVHD